MSKYATQQKIQYNKHNVIFWAQHFWQLSLSFSLNSFNVAVWMNFPFPMKIIHVQIDCTCFYWSESWKILNPEIDKMGHIFDSVIDKMLLTKKSTWSPIFATIWSCVVSVLIQNKNFRLICLWRYKVPHLKSIKDLLMNFWRQSSHL